MLRRSVFLLLALAGCTTDDVTLATDDPALSCDVPLPAGWFELTVDGGGAVEVDLGDRRAVCRAARCRYPLPATAPVLTPRPDSRRAFQGWRDCADAGSRAACILPGGQTTATAVFAPLRAAIVHTVATAGFDALGPVAAAGDGDLVAIVDSGDAPGAAIAVTRLDRAGAPRWTTALPPRDGTVRITMADGDALVTAEPYWEGDAPALLHRIDGATGWLRFSVAIDYRTSHAVGLPGGETLVCNGEEFVWCRRFAADGSGPIADWAVDDMAMLRGLAVAADGSIVMATQFHTDSRNGHSHLRAYALDGTPRWTVALNARTWRPYNEVHAMASDGDAIVVAGTEERQAYLASYAAADGAPRWRVPLPMDGTWPALGIEQLVLAGDSIVAVAAVNAAVTLASDWVDRLDGDSAAAVLRFDLATGAARSARRLGALSARGAAVTPDGIVVAGSTWASPIVLGDRELPSAGKADGVLLRLAPLR